MCRAGGTSLEGRGKKGEQMCEGYRHLRKGGRGGVEG